MPRSSRIIPGAIVAFLFVALLVWTGAWNPLTEAFADAFGIEVEASGDAAAALAELDTVTVKGKAPMTGYDREGMFGTAWIDSDRNGCDQRNDVLDRDLMAKTYEPDTRDCVVITGTLDDPYTGVTIRFTRGQDTSTAVQIDHIYPLGMAWRQGAQQWTQDQRIAFANDFDNLVAVDGPANGQKGDSGPAAWLPSNKRYRCEYVIDFVEVTAKYDLSMPQPDVDAARRVLEGC
ncbi:HNH endonuclease [Agromyces sp. ISL-38]|uniref:HNH endonuclease family protein n=1 Tax=Agromyces sp. ISL-38 TaxID=2819107 RepID=UPI001BEBCA38|nr:HNH endonuclease family protein [Agromyces sp. ISL-38]MBT2499979.1 HNH endonuclease [Agromyces sp. ISL-38]MBT2515886.1 HNH endonuclease [Streptomyces sp. ISL-90]